MSDYDQLMEKPAPDMTLDDIEKLRQRVRDLHGQLKQERRDLKQEQALTVKLHEENNDLRNRVLGVRRSYGHFGDFVSIDLHTANFYQFSGEERDEYVTVAVCDAVQMLLRAGSREAHLSALRRKVMEGK